MKTQTRVGLAIGFILACVMGGVFFATVPAGANNAPFEVHADRIVFESPMVDNGHVNIRLTNGQQLNWHMESKCISKTDHECGNIRHHRVGLTLHEEALLIGKTVLPVSVPAGECIEWVQWSETNYHFGEQGEDPVCNVSVVEPPVANPPVVVVPDVPEVVDPPVSGKPDTPSISEESDKPLPPERVETASGNVILFATSWFTIGMVAGALLGAILVNSRDE